MKKTLVIGACGQIGTELVLALREKFGMEAVVAADLKSEPNEALSNGPYVQMNILEKESIPCGLIYFNI